jgi:hypothetical protein
MQQRARALPVAFDSAATTCGRTQVRLMSEDVGCLLGRHRYSSATDHAVVLTSSTCTTTIHNLIYYPLFRGSLGGAFFSGPPPVPELHHPTLNPGLQPVLLCATHQQTLALSDVTSTRAECLPVSEGARSMSLQTAHACARSRDRLRRLACRPTSCHSKSADVHSIWMMQIMTVLRGLRFRSSQTALTFCGVHLLIERELEDNARARTCCGRHSLHA